MASDPRDYRVELSSSAGASGVDEPAVGAAGGRPFLSVLFACCGVYARVYRAADGKRYVGHCPRCARAVRFAVGEGGTGCRAFVVE